MPDSSPSSDPAADQPPRKRGLIRRLYDWTIHWAATPHALAALVALSFAESSFFPIPPDVLLIAIVASAPLLWWRTALACSLASVAGGVAGFFIGLFAWIAVRGFFFSYIPGFTPERFHYVTNLYHDHAFLGVLTAAFTPIPYKIFTIAAGVVDAENGIRLNELFSSRSCFIALIAGSAIGRSMRFFIVAGLLRLFGAPIRSFIEKYFEWLSLAFAALLIGGFAALGFLK